MSSEAQTAESVKLVLNDAENKVEREVEAALDHALEGLQKRAEDKTETIKNETIREAVNTTVDVAVTMTEIVGDELIDMAGDVIFEELKEKTSEIGVKPETLAVIIQYAMEAVEKTPKKGKEQKNYVINLVTALIMAQASEEDKPALKEALKTVPATIDIIVAATKGEVDINQVAKVASSCLPCCFKLFSKK